MGKVKLDLAETLIQGVAGNQVLRQARMAAVAFLPSAPPELAWPECGRLSIMEKMENCRQAPGHYIQTVAHEPLAPPEAIKSGGLFIMRRGTFSLLTEL